VCGGFARFLSAHVLAALATSLSWLMLHGAILQLNMRSANNPRTNPSLGLGPKLGALQGISGLGVKKLEGHPNTQDIFLVTKIEKYLL